MDEIVDGFLDPKEINVSGVYVDRVYESDPKSIYTEKKIERLAFSKEQKEKLNTHLSCDLRMKIMKRAAR